MKIVLQGVVGSQAFGFATPESDIDYAGVFIHSTDVILGLRPYDESVSRTGSADKAIDPDTSLHEVKKFLVLAVKANPTALDVLWLPDYQIKTEEGDWLLELRKAVTTQQIRASYHGSAVSVIQQVVDKKSAHLNDGKSAPTEAFIRKSVRHAMRYMIQGDIALRTGILPIRLPEHHLRSIKVMEDEAVERWPNFRRLMYSWLTQFDSTPSNLPIVADLSAVNATLLKIRKAN